MKWSRVDADLRCSFDQNYALHVIFFDFILHPSRKQVTDCFTACWALKKCE